MKNTSINVVVASVCLMAILITTAHAQHSFHTDAFQNSYTVKIPGSQQTFTRFFGAQPQLQQQQQQNLHTTNSLIRTKQPPVQPQLIRQLATSQQQNSNYNAQREPLLDMVMPYFAQDLSTYYQQVQLGQQQLVAQKQVQQHSSENIEPQQYIDASPGPDAPEHQLNQHLGVAYSSADQVSQVQFTSNGLNYNF